MPGFIVHSAATVKCAHGGIAMPVAAFPRVLVGGQPVVLALTLYQVAGCAMPPPIAGNGPCLVGQFLNASTRVLAQGTPILLQDSIGLCVPTGTPLLVGATQSRVTGT